MLKKILGLVGVFAVSLGLLWATNKYVLKREQSVLEMTWMLVLSIVVVGIAGFIMVKGFHISPTPKVSG